MAVKVELPKELIKAALDQAHALRMRNAKAATNNIIQQALEAEAVEIAKAIQTLETMLEKQK